MCLIWSARRLVSGEEKAGTKSACLAFLYSSLHPQMQVRERGGPAPYRQVDTAVIDL